MEGTRTTFGSSPRSGPSSPSPRSGPSSPSPMAGPSSPFPTAGTHAFPMAGTHASPPAIVFTVQEIRQFTNNFATLIGQGGFGDIFRGHLEDQHIVVKASRVGQAKREEWQKEIEFLQMCNHPNVIKLLGVGEDPVEERFFLVYPYFGKGALRNHIAGAWSDKTDVFAYGVILLGLIAKRVYDLKNARYLGTLNYVFFWAWTEYNENPSKKTQFKLWGMYKKHKKSQSNKSLVDKSLESDQYFDAGDGVEITKLAMRCVEENPERRPMMKEVVCCLRELNVVKKSSHVVLPKMSVGSSGGDGILCTSSPATDLVQYNYEELASITGGFSEENFIGNTLYGKVFRGKIQQDSETQEVVVKIWVNCRRFATTPELQKSRLDNEI